MCKVCLFPGCILPLLHIDPAALTMSGICAGPLPGRVDGLSPVQWHPYSTVGGDGEHTLVAHIKAYGKWVPVHALCLCAKAIEQLIMPFTSSSTSPTQIPCKSPI